MQPELFLISYCLILLVGVIIGVKLKSLIIKRQNKDPSDLPVKHKLQLLFDSYSDNAIEAFINSLEVSSQTLSLHISIGKYFRSQGEVDKAILIHQNLMSHPGLSVKESESVIFELAKDYKTAGLLDRALALFQQLRESKQFSSSSINYILDIYESEKDWDSAIGEISHLNFKKNKDVALRLSHYHCESASVLEKQHLYADAEVSYQKARSLSKDCFRALLGLAKIAFLEKRYSQAISYLKAVASYSPENTALILPLLQEITSQTKSFSSQQAYLQDRLSSTGQISILMAIVDSMILEGDAGKARAFLFEYLEHHKNIKVLRRLFSLGLGDLSLSKTKDIVESVLTSLPSEDQNYKCRSCGFTSSHLLWLCPSCKAWQSIQPVVEYE